MIGSALLLAAGPAGAQTVTIGGKPAPRRQVVPPVTLDGQMVAPAPAETGTAAAPAAAKSAPVAPPPVAQTAPAPATMSLPVLAPPPPVPLPALTAAQVASLRSLADVARVNGIAPPDDYASLDGEALALAAVDLAQALHAGRVASDDFLHDWGLRPEPYDARAALVIALSADSVPSWIASLTPPYAGYDGLRRGLARYRRIADAGGWRPIGAGADLTLGSKGDRVVALRRRLHVEDPAVAPDGDTYDADLLAAVRRAQNRYGLNPTGIVAGQTLAQLDVPVAERIAQITANMERWRWMPRAMPADRIQVNIAAAVMTVFDGDQPVESMRAVTGRPDDATPMLTSAISSIVVNPPWNVPSSIATKELWPKEKAHPGYLRRNGFRVIATPEGGSRLQQSSARSALGHYKFDFPNPYAVYLHDTPTQATFSSYDRLASHGCVRLQHPAALAARLLADDPAWGPDQLQAAVAKGDTQRVMLQQPVAVFLLYWTAYAGGDGAMNFRDDPYKWDDVLAQKVDARNRQTEVAAN